MTVRELIAELQTHDQDALVWIPISEEGYNGHAKYVGICPHTDLPDGVAVSDDVVILPMEMSKFIDE